MKRGGRTQKTGKSLRVRALGTFAFPFFLNPHSSPDKSGRWCHIDVAAGNFKTWHPKPVLGRSDHNCVCIPEWHIHGILHGCPARARTGRSNGVKKGKDLLTESQNPRFKFNFDLGEPLTIGQRAFMASPL